MDREINERAVISTGAQRQEVFHSNGGAAKLTVCVCVCVSAFAHSTCVCVHACICAFACLCLNNRGKKREAEKDRKTLRRTVVIMCVYKAAVYMVFLLSGRACRQRLGIDF